MATIYDIAKKTGFSITTVSKALNNYTDVSEKTKKVILEAVDELGYYPNSIARSLTTKKSWTLGVIFVEDLNVGMKHPFFSAVIESFKKQVESLGYDLIFLSRNIGREKKSYLDHALHRGVDGVIVVCSNYEDNETQMLIESSLPSVVVDLHSDTSSVVYSDNYQGSVLAVRHLHSLGHRKIAHISGVEQTFAGLERLRGYQDTVKQLKLDIPEGYVVDGGFFSYDGGYDAMKELLDHRDRPTAVYVAGDDMALGAMKACRDMNVAVPADVSVVGFDDIEVAKHVTPALTTIRQDTDLIGRKASELLVNQINSSTKNDHAIKVPVALVERESTKGI
ncbi:LacI family DNA-binding transcriptional regulator [Alteribacter aurantiacus]|uniref:LacI family DNA-binding transcriptional regulator n=1 Tax=Alteribacter aurantiacus TaxID=254410 RepID=UPI00040267D0|nr:LacI family DNA-binding transcriptional regulator [Alteribacter aurantiacus]